MDIITPNDSIHGIIMNGLPQAISSKISTAFGWVFAVCMVNLFIIILKWGLECKLKNKDVKINRINIIQEHRVECENAMYNKLQALFDIVEDQPRKLKYAIKSAQKYLKENDICMGKKIRNISTEVIDYFLSVQVNFSNKNINKEEKWREEYIKEFNR